MTLKVYFASQLHHARKWLDMSLNSGGHYFTHARWLRHVMHYSTTEAPENANWFWCCDHEDVVSADVLVCYAEGDDHLRGALVEVGIALASGVQVVVVGNHHDYGTWQHHPGVTRVADLSELHQLLVRVCDFNRDRMAIGDGFEAKHSTKVIHYE